MLLCVLSLLIKLVSLSFEVLCLGFYENVNYCKCKLGKVMKMKKECP